MAASKPLRCTVLAAILALLAALAICCSDPASSSDENIVVFSDIHFNPFYDPALFDDLVDTPETGWQKIFESSAVSGLQTWGQESRYRLMLRAVESTCRDAQDAAFVVYGGDMLTHHFDALFYQLYGSRNEEAMRAFTRKTVNFFAGLVRAKCGSVPVLLSLGNNDDYAGDYKIEPNGAFLQDTADLVYTTLLLNAPEKVSFYKTWKAGGYYTVESIARNLSIISLNTILFSKNAPAETRAAAQAQLRWLGEALAEAALRNRRVWLLLHIPPGVDIYATAARCIDASGSFTDAVMMWQGDFLASFLDIVDAYPGTISVMTAGHTHMDEYRLVPAGARGGAVPVVNAPAISPVFGNNPAYKVLTVSKNDWGPTDCRSVFAPLDTADQRFTPFYSSFIAIYGQSPPLGSAMVGLYDALKTDPVKQKTYSDNYYSGHDASNPIDPVKWPAYRCGIANMSKDAFLSCANAD